MAHEVFKSSLMGGLDALGKHELATQVFLDKLTFRAQLVSWSRLMGGLDVPGNQELKILIISGALRMS